jgi:multiple sugar transport system permease protein
MKAAAREAWMLLAPAAIVLGTVTLVPMLYVVELSFEHRSVLHPPAFAGLENYGRLVQDERFWRALGNTLYFTIVSVGLELGLGLAAALLLVHAGRARAFAYGAMLVPWAIPGVVSARMWEWIYNAEYGVLNFLLGTRTNWLGDPVLALHAVIAMDVWKSTPFVALLVLAGLQGIPRELHRAAAIDGATAWTTFRRITLPLLAPALLVAAVFRTIDALRVFDAVYVLTGGGPADGTQTLSVYAYRILFQTLDFGYGAALSVTVLMITAAATWAYARVLREGAP